MNLLRINLEVLTDEDGSIIGAVADLSDPLLDLLMTETALQHRRLARVHGLQVYDTEHLGEVWRVSVAHRMWDASENRHCFEYSIERVTSRRSRRREGSDSSAVDDDLIDALPDAVVVADLEGSIVYANRSAVTLLGAESREVLIGQPIWGFVHPEELASARREGWLVEGGKRVEYVRHRVVRRDGQSVPVEIVTRRSRYRGKPAILISAHDLTGLRIIEQALEETQQLFYRVFKTGPLAIVVSRLSDRTLVDVNDAFCRLVGHPRTALINRRLDEVGIAYDRERVDQLRDRISLEGAFPEIELQIVDGRGRIRTLLASASRIDVQGEPCMLTMANDITERKESALALQESEERFRAMADSAPVLIWISDPESRSTYFNRRWLEFTGRDISDEVSGGWMENVHDDDVDRCVQVFNRASQRRETITMEYRLRRHDGVYRWMLNRAIPRFLPDNTFIGYIGSCVDITNRKQAEQKLLHAKKHAEEMTILKSAFLTNMTHEIRTPLTVILGFTSILRQGTRREYQRFVNLIERSGRRLLLMLDSVLDLAQLEAGTLTVDRSRQNVADIVHGVVATLAPIAEEKHLYLRYEEPEDVPYAIADASVLARVLNNLLDNAIKFTETGGVTVSLIEEEHHVSIRISDTGIGIGDRFMPHVFDAFSQESTGIERTHQGSGLGLTVSKQLLELLEGSLTLESRKGEGSTVIVRLPR